MYLNAYQLQAQSTAVYPGKGTVAGLEYCTLGLCGEAGEVAGAVKRILRDDEQVLTPERRAKVLDEAGDVLWYLAGIAEELGTSLSEIAQVNLDKLAGRKQRGTIHGEGGNR